MLPRAASIRHVAAVHVIATGEEPQEPVEWFVNALVHDRAAPADEEVPAPMVPTHLAAILYRVEAYWEAWCLVPYWVDEHLAADLARHGSQAKNWLVAEMANAMCCCFVLLLHNQEHRCEPTQHEKKTQKTTPFGHAFGA